MHHATLVLIYTLPTLIFAINVFYFWEFSGLKLGLNELIVFAVTDVLILLPALFLNKNQKNNSRYLFSERALLVFSFCGAILCFIFITKHVNSFSIGDLFIFTNNYRNGALSGSFFYTFLILRIIPIWLSLNIIKNGFSKKLFSGVTS